MDAKTIFICQIDDASAPLCMTVLPLSATLAALQKEVAAEVPNAARWGNKFGASLVPVSPGTALHYFAAPINAFGVQGAYVVYVSLAAPPQALALAAPPAHASGALLSFPSLQSLVSGGSTANNLHSNIVLAMPGSQLNVGAPAACSKRCSEQVLEQANSLGEW
jgi:hypothetical protein